MKNSIVLEKALHRLVRAKKDAETERLHFELSNMIAERMEENGIYICKDPRIEKLIIFSYKSSTTIH